MAEGTTTVQALELQIKSNAMGASSSLTALATSLGKIKEKIAGGLNLGNVATEIGKFVTNLKSIGTNDDIDRITKLTNSITGLVNAMKNLSGVKGGTAALKQAVDSTSAVKEYVGKHVGSEYVGRHENANYVGRHETDDLREAAQEAAKVAEMAATTAKSETVSAEEANKMTSALAESAAKAKETQAAVLATAESLKAAKASAVEISTAARVPAMATREQMLANRAALAAERGGSVSGMFGRPNIDRSGYVKASEALADKLSDAAARALGLKGTMEGVAIAAERGARASVALAGMATATSHTETAGAGLKGAADSVSDAKASIADTGKEAEKSASKLETLRSAVDSLKHSFKDLTKHGVLGFLNSMIRVAKYRMYRALIRNITEGFSTGLKNLREYSKAVDNLYNKDMTGLDNSLLKMKNSLGAVLGSAIQSLIPLFQQLSQWVITASNYINQFIALLSGRNTWTRAVDVVAADFEKTEKSAAGAAKETKNLLAAWDELNIIQSQGGNGGGGSGNADNVDYTKMFEEVNEFDSGLKRTVDWLRDNMGWLLTTVEAIGGAMLAWRIGNGLITSMAALGPVVASVAGTILGAVAAGVTVYLDWHFMSKFADSEDYADLTSANVITGIGSLLTALLVGKGFSKSPVGGVGPALVAGGAVATITGLVDTIIAFGQIDVEGLTKPNLLMLVSGAVKESLGMTAVAIGIAQMNARKHGAKLTAGQAVGAGLAIASLTAMVNTNVLLTKGALSGEDADGGLAKILESLATDAVGTVGVALGGAMFGGKQMALKATGAALIVTAVTDLALAMGEVQKGNLSMATIITEVKSALGLGVGAAALTAGSARFTNLAKSIGTNAMGIGVMTFTVAASVIASATLNTSGIQEGSLAKVLLSAATDAVTSAALGIHVAKASGGNVRAGMATAAIPLVLSGALKLATTISEVDVNDLTDEQLTSLITSGLETAFGIGLGVAATGHPVLGVVAGVATLVVEGAAFLVQKLKSVALKKEDTIDWGPVKLTADEVASYVKSEFLDQKIVAEMDVLGVRLKELKQNRDVINAQVALFGLTLNKIKIGTKLDEGSYNKLKEQLTGEDGIIPEMEKQLAEESEYIALSLKIAPLTDQNGNDISAQFLSTIDVSSGELGEAIRKIGDDIADLMTKAYQQGLTEDEGVWLETLTDVLYRVNSALNLGEAEAHFRLKVNSLVDFDKDTFGSAVEEYGKAKDELRSEYREQYESQYATAFSQMRAWEALYQHYDNVGDVAAASKAKERLDELAAFVAIYEDPDKGIDYLIDEALKKATVQYDNKFVSQILELVGGGRVTTQDVNFEAYKLFRGNRREEGNAANAAYSAFVASWTHDVGGGRIATDTAADIDKAEFKKTMDEALYYALPMLYGFSEAKVIQQTLDAGIGKIEDYVSLEEALRLLGMNTATADVAGINVQDLASLIIESWATTGKPVTVSNEGTHTGQSGVIEAIEETMEEGETVIEVGMVGPAAGDVPVAPPGAPTYDEPADDDSATETAQAEQTTVLRGMLTVLQQLLNKEVTARFVPSAAAGAAVQQAIRMAERMSG